MARCTRDCVTCDLLAVVRLSTSGVRGALSPQAGRPSPFASRPIGIVASALAPVCPAPQQHGRGWQRLTMSTRAWTVQMHVAACNAKGRGGKRSRHRRPDHDNPMRAALAIPVVIGLIHPDAQTPHALHVQRVARRTRVMQSRGEGEGVYAAATHPGLKIRPDDVWCIAFGVRGRARSRGCPKRCVPFAMRAADRASRTARHGRPITARHRRDAGSTMPDERAGRGRASIPHG